MLVTVLRILPIVAVLACAGAARAETWRLVGSESPPIEWAYADGGFSRSGTSAHYVRQPGGERFDVQFTWQVPEVLTAGVAAEVSLTADVVAGWPCRPLFLGARVFLSGAPCAFCVDGRDVGAGICAEHGEGTRTVRVEPGNFGQAEARLHVHATDGSLFGGIAATYVYARDVGPPTATATRTRTPSSPPTPTATHTRTPAGSPTATATQTRTPSRLASATATRTRSPAGSPTTSRPPTRTPTERPTGTPTIPPTRTPTGSQPGDLACGETREGLLDAGDLPLFDAVHAELHYFTLSQTTDVYFAMDGSGFEPYLELAYATYPYALTWIIGRQPPLAYRLDPDRYAIAAGTLAPLAAAAHAYTLTMICDGGATATATPSRTTSPTPSRTPSPSPSPTAAPPTPTRIPTATGTATRQATRTPSPTATAEVCEIGGDGGIAGVGGCEVDLVADHIEVIQSIQDLENSVDLVAYKRTFVRFHVHALGRDAEATATLQLELGGPGGLATDLSHPPITVRQRPERGLLGDSFLFEIPRLYLSGRVFLTATVNAENAPRESRRDNNRLFETIRYEEPLPFELVLYRVSGPGGMNAPAPLHLRRIPEGLESMYPIAEAAVWHRELTLDHPVDFRRSNRALETMRRLDLAYRAIDTPREGARHYAVWDDYDRQILKPPSVARGYAGGVPAFVASGAGVASDPKQTHWDADGSVADSVAAHELAHTLGRFHAEFCKAAGGEPFPYAHGFMSPALDGPRAIWGLDAQTLTLYPPVAGDLMTYCYPRWISDFTYEALLRQYLPASGSAAQAAATDVRLLVVGTIDAGTGAVTLEPLFSMPTLVEDEPVVGTGYTIDQYDAGGGLLARHPFLPRRTEALVAGGGSAEEPELLMFSETVPYASGAQRLAIAGPGISHVVQAGMAPPEVTVHQPNRRATLAGERLTVAWEGFDPDGDPLTYRLQYSPDDRSSWITVATALTDTQIDVDRTQLRASENGRFRVWVSDGLHTGFDDSDDSVILPNVAPSAEIVAPADGATFLARQTVALVGRGYDVDQGPLPAAQLRWRSSRDGELGSGAMLGRADLSVGEHVVTFEARDRQGAVASDTVTVRVVATAAELPPAPDQLAVAPSLVAFDTRVGRVEATVTIDNRGAASLPWQATASDPWIDLDPDAGRTRAQVRVGLGTGLGAGVHEGTITFSTEDGGAPVVVPVTATVGACPGDCDGDGVVTIDELLSGVNLLLADAGSDDCRALDVSEDGRTTIDEVIRAINSALNGCS